MCKQRERNAHTASCALCIEVWLCWTIATGGNRIQIHSKANLLKLYKNEMNQQHHNPQATQQHRILIIQNVKSIIDDWLLTFM